MMMVNRSYKHVTKGVHTRPHSENSYFEVFKWNGVIYWSDCDNIGSLHYGFREGPFKTLKAAYTDAIRRD